MQTKAQKILDTTIRLFLRDGIKKTTMNEIAAGANASKMTIYKYFADKDTLYLQVGKHILDGYEARLRAVADSRDSLSGKLYAALNSITAFTDSGEFALCMKLAAYHPAVEAELARYDQTYRATLYALINAGIVTGRMKPGLDQDMIFHYIDMGVTYYQQNAAYRQRMRTDGVFQKRFMLFFTSNIFADSPAAPSGA